MHFSQVEDINCPKIVRKIIHTFTKYESLFNFFYAAQLPVIACATADFGSVFWDKRVCENQFCR